VLPWRLVYAEETNEICSLCVALHIPNFYLFSNSTKEAQPEEDPSVAARLQRLQNNYEDFGMRRTVEGILVVHDHGHPHILMLQIANAFFKLCVAVSAFPSPTDNHTIVQATTSSPEKTKSKASNVGWMTDLHHLPRAVRFLSLSFYPKLTPSLRSIH